MFSLIYVIILMWAANSMVEYSAFNRLVLGSSPRQPKHKSLRFENFVFNLFNNENSFNNEILSAIKKIILFDLVSRF